MIAGRLRNLLSSIPADTTVVMWYESADPDGPSFPLAITGILVSDDPAAPVQLVTEAE